MSADRPTTVAVIPARGGSKGIRRKNLVQVLGRPLLAWSIVAAQDATLVDRIVVSTDDEEIAEVAADWGAQVPALRPAELAADDTPDLPVFEHLLGQLPGMGEGDVVVHLRPTSPVRPAGLVDAAIRALLRDGRADSVRSVSPVDKSPYKMWTICDGLMQPLCGAWDAELFNQPRQALPPVWQHDGVVDVVRASTILAGSMTGRNVLPFFTPPGASVDIDVESDLVVAERLLAAVQAEGG